MIWEEFPLFGLFGIISEGLIPAPFCMSGRIHLENLSGPGLLLVGRLLIAASTSVLVIGLFKVSTYSWFRLGRVQVSISSRFTGLYA